MTEATVQNAGQLVTSDQFIDFIFAGNATITLVSGRTGKRYTYKVAKAKDSETMFFLSAMTGPDNTSDFEYLGFIKRPYGSSQRGQSLLLAGKKGKPTDVRFKGFAYVLDAAYWGDMPADAIVYHEGKCCRCGRKLTTPESISSGIGPECAKK